MTEAIASDEGPATAATSVARNPAAPPRGGLPSLAGLDRVALAEAIEPLGLTGFRVRQLWHWIYYRGARSFEEMTTIAKPVRARLADAFTLERPSVATEQRSVDGTRKWLVRFDDGNLAETVHIPETDRGTLCISSQVGCTLNCRFCHTGTQRLVRNLDSTEIVGQLLLARDSFDEWPAPDNGRRISNIVMMGMGEPLYNWEAVRTALQVASDGEGLGISRRRITLSTAGVVPMIERCGAELGVNLAISLHAVTDELRDRIVPINRKYPIADLMQACRTYPGLTNARRITFEYVMLKDVNDSDADARALVRLLEGVPAKVNLIPFNPWPGAPFECSSPERIRKFSDIVADAGYVAPVRTPRGQDISAACGQLKSESVKLSRRERDLAEAAAAAQ